MDIQKLTNTNRFDALVYMENRINSGSLSGFSGDQKVLGEFAAGRLTPFSIPIVEGTKRIINFYHETCDHNHFIDKNLIPIHPLFLQILQNSKDDYSNVRVIDSIDAFVTASGRTVIAKKRDTVHFLKLHFPGVLGRVNRHIPLRKGFAGVEVSTLVSKHIKSRELGMIGLLPEIKCVGIEAEDNSIDEGSWAYIDRCGTITTQNGNDEESVLIPAFSLLAPDPDEKEFPTILEQLCIICSIDTLDKFRDVFIQPLLEAYLKLTFIFGLMPEINAQNLLYAYKQDINIIYPVLRDMGRVEKLPYINELVGTLQSCPYKTNTLDLPDDYAKTRHSFSFDFKLCGYVIIPLLKAFCKYKNIDFYEAKDQLSKYGGILLDEHANVRDYLPRERFIKGHPKQLLTQDRPYIDCGYPHIN